MSEAQRDHIIAIEESLLAASDQIADLQAKLSKAEEERDHLRLQIRGHCALIVGRRDHTDSPVDCLSEVHQAVVDRDRQLSSALKVVEAAEKVAALAAGFKDDGSSHYDQGRGDVYDQVAEIITQDLKTYREALGHQTP